jgi:2TM domain
MSIDETTTVPDDDIRDRAIKRLKKKREFQAHLLVYVLVNTFLVVIWSITGSGFFWPVFPIVGWGIGVVMNGWDVYHSEDFAEADIQHEVERILAHR